MVSKKGVAKERGVWQSFSFFFLFLGGEGGLFCLACPRSLALIPHLIVLGLFLAAERWFEGFHIGFRRNLLQVFGDVA